MRSAHPESHAAGRRIVSRLKEVLVSSSRNVTIGIWGGTQSGKTTYLSALEIATLLDPTGSWNIFGNDEASPGSVDFLLNGSESLRAGYFPPNTTSRQPYTYEIIGRPAGFAGLVSSLRETVGMPRPFQFNLNVFDYPGGDLLKADPADPLWEQLATCDGLVYLFDPHMSDVGSDNFKCLSRSMSMMRQVLAKHPGALLSDGRLPHHLAVCVTKFDDDKVFTRLRQAGLVSYDENRPEQPPQVKEVEKAFECFADIFTIPRIRRSFKNDRVRFFLTSSIGFYRDEQGRVDIERCCNVVQEPGGNRIRGTPIPYGVFEPLLWIQNQFA